MGYLTNEGIKGTRIKPFEAQNYQGPLNISEGVTLTKESHIEYWYTQKKKGVPKEKIIETLQKSETVLHQAGYEDINYTLLTDSYKAYLEQVAIKEAKLKGKEYKDGLYHYEEEKEIPIAAYTSFNNSLLNGFILIVIIVILLIIIVLRKK